MNEKYNVSSSPHIRDKVTSSNIMLYVVIALLPATFFGIWNFRHENAWILVVVTTAAAVLSEYLYEKLMHKPITINDFSAVVTGLLLALNLPPTLPWWMGVLGAVFAIIVVKQLFGGLGQNFMNPALAARCFLLIAYTGPMTNFVTSNGFLDAYSGATPLALLKPGAESTGVVSLAKMFIGTTGGVIGETSAICLLLGGIYLLARKVINWRIPVTYVGVFAVLIFLFAPGHHFDVIYMLEEVCGGGLLLGAIFMATDYVTSPITSKGKVLYAILLGLLTGLFRFFGETAMLTPSANAEINYCRRKTDMNTDKIFAEAIANEYAPKNASKVLALKKLDRKAKRKANIFAYTFGTLMALVLGVGMCLSMGVLGGGSVMMTAGIVVGVIGLIGVGVNYPIYRKLLESGKRKYAFEIVQLAKEISEEAE